MSESKVVIYEVVNLISGYPACAVVPYAPLGTTLVTHADYKALEDELAALRGKVGELVEADRAFDAAVYAYWIDGEENEEDREATTERRRLALEALS